MAESSFDKFLATPTSTKVAVLVLCAGLMGAAWYFLFYGEVEAALVTEQQKTKALAKELAEEQDIEKNLKKYQDEIERLSKSRDEMRDRLPENAEIAELLQQIHGQAKIVGLEIIRFERGDDEVEPMYARIPVTMVLRGTFHQVALFFFYLGKLTRIVNVENIELTTLKGRDAEQNQGLVEAKCTATTFMYVPPTQSAAGAKGGAKKPAKKPAAKGEK